MRGSVQAMRMASIWICAAFLFAEAVTAGSTPTGNPVAEFYDGPDGYPAWTDAVRWSNVVDMAAYPKGKTNFEKFENARDELAARGGGVLYYPAGTYEFGEGPFDGPTGRGLMLKSGVVIRGEAPAGRPLAAREGKLELGTKFVFGFQKKMGQDVPKDWNLIGLMPEKGKGPASVRDAGIAWVHMIGGVIYFGPDLVWGETWAAAKGWKSDYAKEGWKDRKPDGTHPGDPFLGAPMAGHGGDCLPGGRGRLVFGCVLEKSALINDYETCGRAESPAGFGTNGFHMAKFAARIAAYGSRVFVANNVLARSETGNFLYDQTTVRSGSGPGGGNSFVIKETRTSRIMWDYNRVMGIDVNKDLLGLVHSRILERNRDGFFEEGVIVRDNWVFNHGHKGYNVSGKWCTIRDNRNERLFLKGGAPVLGVEAGWRLTLDGFIESSSGGGGMISDNLARAFDVAGSMMWIGDNVFNNTGSDPGNDGEGICCQQHCGTPMDSWAITGNRKEDAVGGHGAGFIGGWAVPCRGLLVGWNTTRDYVGALLDSNDDFGDMAIVGNTAAYVLPSDLELGMGYDAKVIFVAEGPRGSRPVAPEVVSVEPWEGDAVRIVWKDLAGKPPPPPDPAAAGQKAGRPPPKPVRETGYRVDRQIGDGDSSTGSEQGWHTIAFRPPQTVGLPQNPPEWVDFLAPSGRELKYRVVALHGHPELGSPSAPSEPIRLSKRVR